MAKVCDACCEPEDIEKSRECTILGWRIKYKQLLITLSPFPLYLFIIGITQIDHCFLQFEPIPIVLLIGLFLTIEVSHLTLFAPPRRYGGNDIYGEIEYGIEEESDDEKESEEDEKLKMVRKFHVYSSLFPIYSFPFCCIMLFFQLFSHSCPLFFAVLFLPIVVSFFIGLLIHKQSKEYNWMMGFSASTIWNSIFFQLIGTVFMIIGSLFLSGGMKTWMVFIGGCILLGEVIHLRFAYFYKNPPNGENILNIKTTRNFLKNWYCWMLLMNSTIWGLAFLPVIYETEGICSNVMFNTLLTFCVAVPIILIAKIIYCCYKKVK